MHREYRRYNIHDITKVTPRVRAALRMGCIVVRARKDDSNTCIGNGNAKLTAESISIHIMVVATTTSKAHTQ